MANRQIRQNRTNRNLPELDSSEGAMPFTNSRGTNKPEILSSSTPSTIDQVLDENDEILDALKQASLSQEDIDEAASSNTDYNPVDDYARERYGLNPKPNDPDQKTSNKFKPTIGNSKPEESSSGVKPKSGSGSSSKSEAATLGGIIKDEREQQLNAIRQRAREVEEKKVGKYNLRGQARKKVRLFLLGSLMAVMLAVPIGVIGIIPHAIQNWIENRVSEYSQRAMDKLGQRVMYTFIRDRVAVDTCRSKYSAAANASGISPCRPRLNERNSRLSQLFNDWSAADMEDKLVARGINVEYDPDELQSGRSGKPYKITIDGENFSASGDFNSPDWDITEFTGKRETSILLRGKIKQVLKEDTNWWQYMKRRNLKAGYLRDLGLPARVFPNKKVAKALDDFDVAKNTSKSRFRQYLTKWVVSKGDGRVGVLLELLFSGDSSKGTPSEMRKSNKALSLAAEKLGVKDVDGLIAKYAGKNLQEIELELFKSLMRRLFTQLGERIGEAATKAIPVVGWVMLGFTVLDLLDMATDGTLQNWISASNAAAMLDMSNFMDTIISEERRGFVDAQSAGDLRMSLVSGLGSSRVFSNLVGYKSPSGKKADGYNCKPKVSLTDMSSFLGATDQIFKQGDPTVGAQQGMSDSEDVCENHRVDYDPLSAFGTSFDLIQNGVGPWGALSTYTSGCFVTQIVTPGAAVDPPGCPSTQSAYHSIKGGIGWIGEKFSFLTNWIAELPPVKWLDGNVTGWITNATTILITGQTLAGPQLLQGGVSGEGKPGARTIDSWYGGASVTQSAFAKGGVDGGGLGAVPLTPAQASNLNNAIAADRKQELASSSIFERMFDVSHADTAISGTLAVTFSEGGVDNLINPMANISTLLKSSSKSTFAEGTAQENCSKQNEEGQAVNEFGVLCYAYTDEMIEGLSDEDLDRYSDPEFCESYTSAIDARRAEAESGASDTSRKDPDGSGTSTEPDYCRAMCTVTDTMGTEFRQDDPICGYEDFEGIVDTSSTGSPENGPVAGAMGKCEAAPITRPNAGKPKNDIELQVVPGTTIDIRADYCMNAKNMVEAAAADGVTLNGGGFRTYDEQVALRKSHCGSSNDAIYNVSPNACSPPTARPGTSNHERGLAIDFSNCSSRSTACYKWLSTNAAQFGFKNLPSESWHWSNNGK